MVVLAFCYWIADIKGFRKWAMPLLVFGTNAIAAFTFATFVAKCSIVFHVMDDGQRTSWHGYVYDRFFEPLAQSHKRILNFRHFFRSAMLDTDVAAVSAQDIHQGLRIYPAVGPRRNAA